MSEMHAGDALWFIHAGLTFLEQSSAPPAVIDHLRDCARVLGAHLGVPEPMDADKHGLIEQLAALANVEAPQEQSRRNSKYSEPDRIESATQLLDAMVASELFSWAEMVEDIHRKLHDSSPFMTDKQFRAVVNIAKKGKYNDDSRFWDEFENEYPMAAAFAEQCADNA